MARIYLFGDESGNLDFSRKPGATRYYVVTTVTLHDCCVGSDLLDLKRRLHWDGYQVGDYFHATDDKQAVRDEVFRLLGKHELRVDATLMEKPKAQPHLAQDENRFYKQAWLLHLKYVLPRVLKPDDEAFVVAASSWTKARRRAAHSALADVITQVADQNKWAFAFWPADTDPCLQVADYCCWAIQRKWESNDDRSHVLIADKIRSEYDAFHESARVYY